MKEGESANLIPFTCPQLVIKKAWKSAEGRFQAAVVDAGTEKKGILCTQSYITVHVDQQHEADLEAACLACNSIFAAYYLFMTSGRCSGYIPEAQVSEITDLPIPESEFFPAIDWLSFGCQTTPGLRH